MQESKAPEVPEYYIETEPLEWPVTVVMPVNGGKFAPFRFTGKFARLSGEQIDELTGVDAYMKAVNEAIKAADTERLTQLEKGMLAKQVEITPEVLLGWGDEVKTRPGGDPVPFSIAALNAQLRGPNGKALAKGIWTAVGEIRNGYRLGNFEPLPATGQHAGQAPAEEPIL